MSGPTAAPWIPERACAILLRHLADVPAIEPREARVVPEQEERPDGGERSS